MTARITGGDWLEICRHLESLAAGALGSGRRARVRAGLPFGDGGITVLFASGTADELAQSTGDLNRPAAILLPAAATAVPAASVHAADFDASFYFPESDPELPDLGLLLAAPEKLALLAGGAPPAARLVSYRPLRRAQVALLRPGANGDHGNGRNHVGGASSFAKLVRPERAARTWRRPSLLAPALRGDLRPAPVIAMDRARGIAIAAAAPGTLLADRLAAANGAAQLARLGRALHSLEQALDSTSALASDLPGYGFADAVADLERFALLLAGVGIGVAADMAGGRARLAALAPAPDSGRRAIVHRDLHDKQVIVGDHLTLLDLDQVSAGDPALDLGNLLAHLRLRSLQGRLGVSCAENRTALLAGYGAAWTDRFADAVRAWEALALFRLAAVYALRPRWSHLGRELARAGHGVLDVMLKETSDHAA